MKERDLAIGTLAVVILTHNEEANIAQVLDNVAAWADETFILDSLSTDRTLEIAARYRCQVIRHKFHNHAKQRNYALDHLPIRSEWVLFLDADEWLPLELKLEISALIATKPLENGFHVKFRLIWMGQWIRRGYYPSWIMRLFRHGMARCEDRAVNEHLIVQGATAKLSNDLMHEDRKSVTSWIEKHNGYATREANELMQRRVPGSEIEPGLFGAQSRRRRWIRRNIWNRMPPLLRPLSYFFYRYILTGGFLDGKAAFVYHFLHALWYPLLIDVKYLEMKRQRTQDPAAGA